MYAIRSYYGRARALAREHIAPRAAHWDQTEQYPWENVERLVEAGFMGMTIPTEYGGPAHSLLDALLVVEEMACGPRSGYIARR